ncbi:VOC family protein [Mesobacillus subterraneus]|jgi:lactoylglutathione lyase|uniref:VOC family protein n=1 Tax=Mesobacillus subterraneus TaxID=285983 RepID=UPI00203AB042|nr:VOC family protein [Mesobacillus subterraneus]MCM3662943.1 VOC family protein [Mesobacillus subterraneus]MCM3682881.1 VOC family protein [Mesobacillus subterraneus]
MEKKSQIHSSLKVLLVTDIERAKVFYSDVLGCEVTDWWVIRDDFTGLAIKLLQANDPKDVKPNPPAKGVEHGFDVYCYVEDWQSLDELYLEFKEKGAAIAIEPWVDENNGPWKEFAVKDVDGYCIAFGGTDGY